MDFNVENNILVVPEMPERGLAIAMGFGNDGFILRRYKRGWYAT